MLVVEKITSSLFPKLYDSFLADDDPLSSEQDWRNVFDYRFANAQGHCGYAMLDGDELVGMMGMVFSERRIDGRLHKLCNLHTWWVREDYRGRSLVLLRPVLTLEGFTITHFTPCDTIRAIAKRLGFESLSTRLRILPPPLGLGRRRREPELIFGAESVAPHLGAADRKILHDHAPYRLGHLLIRDGRDACYLLYTHVVRHGLGPYCHIHYVSDMRLFLEHERTVRAALIRRHRAWFVALDARRLRGVKPPPGFDFWAPAAALCKSDDLCPDQIDNLYSDVVFLKLTTLPDMGYELSASARRLRDRLIAARLLRGRPRKPPTSSPTSPGSADTRRPS